MESLFFSNQSAIVLRMEGADKTGNKLLQRVIILPDDDGPHCYSIGFSGACP